MGADSSGLTVGRRGAAVDLVGREVPARLKRRLLRAMRAAGCEGAKVCLSLVDDEEIHELNRGWRKKDKPTDVLSFSQQEGVPGAAPDLLGDIVISVETAARQAEEGGRTLDDELLHLAVHGLAHLLGYDHATVREERVMFGFEALLREQALGRRAVAEVPRPSLAKPVSRRR